MSKHQKEKHAGTRKACTTCGGEGRRHTEFCITKRAFDAECDCGYPPCPACGGTGVRNRHDGSTPAPETLVNLGPPPDPPVPIAFTRVTSPQFIDEIKHMEDLHAVKNLTAAIEANSVKSLPPELYVHTSGHVCADCGKPATCLGRYEDMTEEAYACDDCCGHGCEDGKCRPVET